MCSHHGTGHQHLNLESYGSALNSYLTFVCMHNFPIDPTPDTLSFFIVYMCHHIKPSLVDNYLFGICQQLEPYFPSIHEAWKSMVCTRTLTGCKQHRGIPTKCKCALSIEDLQLIVQHHLNSHDHDNLLAQMLTGFFTLMRLGELVGPNDNLLLDPCKLTSCISVAMSDDDYCFFLPNHKADKFFKGNTIIIQFHHLIVNPYTHFVNCLSSQDCLFPFSSNLWPQADSSVLTCSFFLNCLHLFFDSDITGQSFWSRVATCCLLSTAFHHT